MAAGLTGDLGSLRKLSKQLSTLSTRGAQRCAEKAAAGITEAAQASFSSGTDPYGIPWTPSKEGDTVKLEDTGAMKRDVTYVAVGKILRVKLGVDYAKYQIGRRPVFPKQDAPLPLTYVRVLEKSFTEAVAEELSP